MNSKMMLVRTSKGLINLHFISFVEDDEELCIVHLGDDSRKKLIFKEEEAQNFLKLLSCHCIGDVRVE